MPTVTKSDKPYTIRSHFNRREIFVGKIIGEQTLLPSLAAIALFSFNRYKHKTTIANGLHYFCGICVELILKTDQNNSQNSMPNEIQSIRVEREHDSIQL